jgi:hypothetical protein
MCAFAERFLGETEISSQKYRKRHLKQRGYCGPDDLPDIFGGAGGKHQQKKETGVFPVSFFYSGMVGQWST